MIFDRYGRSFFRKYSSRKMLIFGNIRQEKCGFWEIFVKKNVKILV